jgi:hypothetical protein
MLELCRAAGFEEVYFYEYYNASPRISFGIKMRAPAKVGFKLHTLKIGGVNINNNRFTTNATRLP